MIEVHWLAIRVSAERVSAEKSEDVGGSDEGVEGW